MDHLATLRMDPELVSDIFHPWQLWESGERRSALELLAVLLQRRIGETVLTWPDEAPDTDLMEPFGVLIQYLLANPLRLHAPPSRVAGALWQQSPCSGFLSAVALGDMRWTDDPFETDPGETPAADELAALLAVHLEYGLISRDAVDMPYGGRPVLSAELVAAADPVKLGPVYDVLRESPSAPAENWWALATEKVPRFVLRTAVRDLFGGRGGRTDPETVWSAICQRHHAYAKAVRDSFERADGAISDAEWDYAGRMLIGRRVMDLRSQLSDIVNR